ncbi:MAG: DUF86 domain-containing protein [Candidatus Yanofskybacteria bacterium]|nr:DUF86 domain-containing protein [Candidatus Yanofskybacteria bacterium]
MSPDKAYLKHILDAISKIETYTKGLDKEQFLGRNNEITRDAVIRQFEIIGEAVGRLSGEIKKTNSTLLWRDISDMRNKLIHEYFGVNSVVVWSTVQNDLPTLKRAIEQMLKSTN